MILDNIIRGDCLDKLKRFKRIPSDSVSNIYVDMTFSNGIEEDAILKECHRILKPTGELHIR